MELNQEKLKNIGLQGYSVVPSMMVLVNADDQFAVVKVTDNNIEQVEIIKAEVENEKIEEESKEPKKEVKETLDVEKMVKTKVDELMKGYMEKMKTKELDNEKSLKNEQAKLDLAKIEVTREKEELENLKSKTKTINKKVDLVEKYKDQIINI